MRPRSTPLLLAAALGAAAVMPAAAQLAVSGNDNKAYLDNGVTRVRRDAPPDTLSVLDLSATPPRLVAEVAGVPHSVVGPPFSVALTPDERLALVASNQVADPADPSRTVPDDRLSVVDLRAEPPRVVATLRVGRGPAGVSVNRAGTLALVANRNAGTVSVLRVPREGTAVEVVGTVEVGPAASGVSHAAFAPDGRHALVTRDGDFQVDVLRVEGEAVTRTGREMSAGLRPYGLVVSPDGRLAAVANIGRGNGDADTVSLVALDAEPFRVVETVTVGQTPEGLQFSPDGRLLAVTVMNGSNKPANSPFRGPGLLRIYRVEGASLRHAGDATVGTWSQGVAFTADGRTALVQNMVERDIQVVAIGPDGRPGETVARIAVSGGPAALRVAERPR